MWSTFRVAAAGAQAQQRALDVAANNLANAETPGYKSFRASLADVAPTPELFLVTDPETGQTIEDREIGGGVVVAGLLPSFAPGPNMRTERPLDLAIVGDGYLRVALPDGRRGFTRAGALQLDAEGHLLAGGNYLLDPPVTVPAGTQELSISTDGRVVGRFAGGQKQELGRLTLARFANPDGLEKLGQDLLLETEASGPPVVGEPGNNGLGTLQSGSLEGSNVNVAEEYVRVVQAQRAYQVNLRQLRTIDEMIQAAYNLQR